MEFMTSYNKENNVYSTQTEEFMYRRKNQHRNQFFIHNTKNQMTVKFIDLRKIDCTF